MMISKNLALIPFLMVTTAWAETIPVHVKEGVDTDALQNGLLDSCLTDPNASPLRGLYDRLFGAPSAEAFGAKTYSNLETLGAGQERMSILGFRISQVGSFRTDGHGYNTYSVEAYFSPFDGYSPVGGHSPVPESEKFLVNAEHLGIYNNQYSFISSHAVSLPSIVYKVNEFKTGGGNDELGRPLPEQTHRFISDVKIERLADGRDQISLLNSETGAPVAEPLPFKAYIDCIKNRLEE